MRRELVDLAGSGLLLAGLLTAMAATLAPTTTGAGVAAPALVGGTAPVEWGRSLFYAKGCTGCHRKGDEHAGGVAIGPDLAGLRDRAAHRQPGLSAEAYVRESIRTPSAFTAPGFEGAARGMPDLGLADAEIDALVAFLLAPDAP